MGAAAPEESGRAARPAGGGRPEPLPLALRNRLAELILEAFDSPAVRATLTALARAGARPGAAVDAGDAARLLALGWFEPAGPGRVRLRGAHRAHGGALRERARRGAAAAAGWRDPGAGELAGLLARAAALADQGLFFEVHELLEPTWFRAAEPVRTALQGLIQTAVAFHHLQHGNRAGARSLLAEGVAKLGAGGPTLPLALAPWLAELRTALAALAAGGGPVPVPRWPRPAGAAG